VTMFVGLPDGFTFAKRDSGMLIGETWTVAVYYKNKLAFHMVSDFDVPDDRLRYAARSVTHYSGWQEFSSLGEMVLVMCTKHRMGVE
jgi:hypothetical protein